MSDVTVQLPRVSLWYCRDCVKFDDHGELEMESVEEWFTSEAERDLHRLDAHPDTPQSGRE